MPKLSPSQVNILKERVRVIKERIEEIKAHPHIEDGVKAEMVNVRLKQVAALEAQYTIAK